MNLKLTNSGPTAPADAAGEREILDGPLQDSPHPALDHTIEEHRADAPQKLDTVVFGVTAVIAIGFVLWGFVSTETLGSASDSGLSWVVHNMGWLFSLVASGFVLFVIWLAAGKFGRIPLGRDDEQPEFRTVSWIAMMFSAGMGIGLMFYGVSEPVAHLVEPPPGTGAVGNPEAVQTAMATTLFHWTLHPWAIYAVVGLAVAYGVFRRGRSLLISSAFAPLIGERRANGPVGRVIDILAIFATLFGSAASLGLGALQIGSGLELVAGIGRAGNGVLVAIITVLTLCFVLSAVSGVSKGIQWLSNTNMVLALVLAVFVFVVGPTVFILNLVPTAVGSYFQDLAMMSARTDAAGGDAMQTWLSGWTIFYWAWWVSWTPFVGMFIARISRGRTVRQFVTGVLLVPSLVSLVWFAVFGGAGIATQQGGTDLAGADSPEATLFSMLQTMPLSTLTSVVVMLLVAIFFVSGADAASIVMGTLSERGTLSPSRPTVIFWGAATGAVAAVMLVVGGEDALSGLQNITIVAALPFLLVMVGLAVALVKDLSSDPLVVRRAYAVAAVEQAIVAGVTQHGDDFTLTYEQAAPGEGVGDLVTLAGPNVTADESVHREDDHGDHHKDEVLTAPTS
ncbi:MULTISPECIES: BCCT family transporter [unclassified Knoellia]|uniref:BCCT family transporter n=1 Tax=Knoellia altitudinis TaxID=3404795 RepID=UPI00361CD56F